MTPPTYITHNGVTRTITEWASLLGISKNAIRARLKSGLTTEEAFSRPKWGRDELNIVEEEAEEQAEVRVSCGSLADLPPRSWLTGLM